MVKADQQAILNVLKMMADIELVFAEFYRACAEAWVEDQDFWLSLERQEKLHSNNIHKMAEIISKITGKTALFSRERAKEARDAYWVYDISKIKNDLGFEPRVDFEDGMRESIEWYKARGEL